MTKFSSDSSLKFGICGLLFLLLTKWCSNHKRECTSICEWKLQNHFRNILIANLTWLFFLFFFFRFLFFLVFFFLTFLLTIPCVTCVFVDCAKIYCTKSGTIWLFFPKFLCQPSFIGHFKDFF